jgi:tetratricopeptide (TPR) repeat protein
MTTVRRALEVAAAVLVWTLLSPAQELSVTVRARDSWVGRKVVAKYDVSPYVNDQALDDGNFHVYTVIRVQGDRYWVKSGTIEGWLDVGQVVLLDRAVDFYSRGIRESPRDPYPLCWRAVIWKELSGYEKAIADLNESIRLDPKDPWAYQERAGICVRKNELDKAIADCTEAIRIDPTFVGAFRTRAQAWDGKKDHDKVIADCTEAIRLDPKDPWAYGERGSVWLEKREFDKAIADSDSAIKLDPRAAFAFKLRGCAWASKSDFDKAIADFNDAIRLDPSDAVAYFNRGSVWLDKKEYERAIANRDQAIRFDPNLGDAFQRRAWIWATCPHAEVRNGKRAVESATRACELTQWKEPFCLQALAVAFAEKGDFKKEIDWQGKANALFPEEESRQRGEELIELYEQETPYRDQ